MANELFKLMGEISVKSDAALIAIDNVLKAAQGLYNYINNNSGTIEVTTGTSTTVINQVLEDVKKLYNHINTNTGKINAENSTALSKIGAVSTAATDVYNLINTKTGTVNIDTTGATQKIAALQESAQTVAGYLGTGSGTTGSTGAVSAIAGALGKGTLQGSSGAIDWSWWSNGFADIAALGSRFLSRANTAVNAFAVAGAAKAVNEIGDFFQAGYEYNTFKETSVAKLKTLLQTTPEDATSFFGELEQFAIDSPLTMEGVMESAVKMLGVGVERNQILGTMQMLGDIALGDSYTMSRIAKAQSDVMANTALLAQEGRQYTEAGVPIWRLLEGYYATQEGHSYYGLSAGELKAQNKVDFPIPYEDVLAALQMATSPGGMFYDAINVMMATTEGQAEKMQDAYRRTAGSLAEAFVSVFSSETIPAMNEILQQLDEWADENPEVLDNLAGAFNNLATFGMKAFITSLEELATAWSTHKDSINSMLILLGGLIYPAHPAVGTAMIVAGGGMLYEDTKDTIAEEVAASNETGDFSIGSALMPDDIETKMAEGATYADLSDEDRERYDKAAWWRTLLAFVDNNVNRVSGDIGWGALDAEKKVKTVDLSKYGIDVSSLGTEDAGRDGTTAFNLGEFFSNGANAMQTAWQELFGSDGKPSFVDQILNFLIPSAGAEEGYYGVAAWNPELDGLWRDPRFDLDNPGNANSLQTVLADLPARIEDAARAGSAAGVAEGVGQISVNGHITTGQVVLDSGAVVGELTPRINMSLGDFYAVSYNDD